jgi:hypothetical protein
VSHKKAFPTLVYPGTSQVVYGSEDLRGSEVLLNSSSRVTRKDGVYKEHVLLIGGVLDSFAVYPLMKN